MATKSFTTEYKLNTKTGKKLAYAIENSRKVDNKIFQSTSDVTDKKEINKIMESFLGDR